MGARAIRTNRSRTNPSRALSGCRRASWSVKPGGPMTRYAGCSASGERLHRRASLSPGLGSTEGLRDQVARCGAVARRTCRHSPRRSSCSTRTPRGTAPLPFSLLVEARRSRRAVLPLSLGSWGGCCHPGRLAFLAADRDLPSVGLIRKVDAARKPFGPVFRSWRRGSRGERWGEIESWIGLDVGKADHHATVLDAGGRGGL